METNGDGVVFVRGDLSLSDPIPQSEAEVRHFMAEGWEPQGHRCLAHDRTGRSALFLFLAGDGAAGVESIPGVDLIARHRVTTHRSSGTSLRSTGLFLPRLAGQYQRQRHGSLKGRIRHQWDQYFLNLSNTGGCTWTVFLRSVPSGGLQLVYRVRSEASVMRDYICSVPEGAVDLLEGPMEARLSLLREILVQELDGPDLSHH
jgi:hypothetical protein